MNCHLTHMRVLIGSESSRAIITLKSIFDQHFQEVPNSYRPLIPSPKTMRCFAMSVNNFAAHHLILMRTHEHLLT